ncbi:hypothetical protein BDZ91DRAFT_725006 [Kalaharituber pfeilii]|nr:hypothetical protein BDZ91DRAFT_725006 [Kalaharituber pfeilii]
MIPSCHQQHMTELAKLPPPLPRRSCHLFYHLSASPISATRISTSPATSPTPLPLPLRPRTFRLNWSTTPICFVLFSFLCYSHFIPMASPF